jgi:hypothetical protein
VTTELATRLGHGARFTAEPRAVVASLEQAGASPGQAGASLGQAGG